jgi:hypothetical protein
MQSSKMSRRVNVSRQDMFLSLGFLVMIDLIILIAWTVVSPSQAVESLSLPEEFSTTVKVNLICRSRQIIWPYVALIWHTLLLIVASVLAFQSRGIIPDFNESRSIGTMIYSIFLFMVFRLIVFLLDIRGLIASNIFGASMSFLYIFDTLFATTIYVIPKCFEAKKDSRVYDPGATQSSLSSLVHNQPRGFKETRRTTPNLEPNRVNINHGRQPFGLKGLKMASIEVNYESEVNFESEASNLRGRQPRRRTSFSNNRGSSSEPPTSIRNDIFHEEERNFRPREKNEDSIMEEVEYDLNDGEAQTITASNGTPTRNNLLPHDSTTASDIGGIMVDLQSQKGTEEAALRNEIGDNL